MQLRSRHYYLLKSNRLSGWLIAPLAIGFIVTGFAITGDYGMNRIISANSALWFHKIFAWPLIVLILAHLSLNTYFTVKRFIRRGTCREKTKRKNEKHISKE